MIRSLQTSRARRLTLAGFILLAATFAIALPRALADSPTVQVVGTTGSPLDVDLSQLAPDVSPGGRTGYSLAKVLDHAEDQRSGLAWRNAEDIEVPKAVGDITLTPAEINVPSGSRPYLFVSDDNAVTFVNPSPAKSYEFKVSGPIRIGPAAVLQVAIKLPAEKIRAGEEVTFTAASGASGSATFTWTIDGAARGGGRTFTETFKEDGSHKIGVEVKDGTLRGYAETKVQVGEAKESKKKREGGGDEKDGGETGTVETTDPYSGYPGGGYGGYGDYGGGYPGGTGTGTPSPTPTPPAPGRPDPQKEPVEPVDDGLVEVSGELVSGSAPAEVIAQAPGGAPEALQEGTPDEPGGIADWVWVTLGLAGLIGLGMLAEKRGSRLT